MPRCGVDTRRRSSRRGCAASRRTRDTMRGRARGISGRTAGAPTAIDLGRAADELAVPDTKQLLDVACHAHLLSPREVGGELGDVVALPLRDEVVHLVGQGSIACGSSSACSARSPSSLLIIDMRALMTMLRRRPSARTASFVLLVFVICVLVTGSAATHRRPR